MKKEIIAAWLLASIAVLAFCGWRYLQPPPLRAQVALLYDRSESMPQGCDSVVALGQRILSLPHVRDGSSLAFFTTGDPSTGFEPVLVVTYPLPVTRLATEGNKRLIERQQAFLLDLRHRCMNLPSTRTSPIVRSMKQVVAHLNALGDNRTVRYLLARTDLRETVESSVKRALSQGLGAPTPRLTINNDGIAIVLCGSAEVNGHGVSTSDRVKEVWAALFSQPSLVQFQPYCAQLPAQLDASR